MNLYLIPPAILLFGIIINEIFQKHSISKALYYVSFALITLMLVFRYGQGTDWFGYARNYLYYFKTNDFSGFAEEAHGEILFKITIYLSAACGVPLEMYLAVIAIISIYCVQRFLMEFCNGHECVALFIMYPIFIMTYLFSAVRQGLVMAAFLGIMLRQIIKSDWKRYILCTVVLSTFHSVALIYLLLPFVVRMPRKCSKIAVGGGIGLALAFIFRPFWSDFYSFRFIEYYSDSNSISILALFLRTIVFVFITYIYFKLDNKTEIIRSSYRIYIFGIILYFVTVTNSFISSRLFDALRYAAIIVIVEFFRQKNINNALKTLLVTLISAFCIFMLCKNINSYIDQGHYRNITAWHYPYISVFDKEELLEYVDHYPYMDDWIIRYPIAE